MQKRPCSKALWNVLRGHGTCVPMRPCAASKGSSAAENSVPKYLRSTAVRYFYTAHSTVPRVLRAVPKKYQNSTKTVLRVLCPAVIRIPYLLRTKYLPVQTLIFPGSAFFIWYSVWFLVLKHSDKNCKSSASYSCYSATYSCG